MSTITLPNIRVSSDLTVGLKLKDGGVAIDWSTLSNIKVSIYADAQRSLAGRCTVAIDETDSTVLVCQYAANKPQYLGVNRVIVQCTYMGETKTYDKPTFTFVRWTDDQEGEEITITDPDIDVEIEVEDVSSSILNQAIAAALQAAEDAEHAAHLIPNQVLLDCEQATSDANAAAAAANAAGITSVQVSVEDNEPGTPSAECSLANKVLSVIFHYLKGETGDAAGFGTITASFVEDGGDPSVLVTTSGPDTAKNIAFTLKNFKGDKGDKGDQGNTGSSVDYPYELVNNCTTDDATKGLSAAQGKALKDELSQLDLKLNEKNYLDGYRTTTSGVTANSDYIVTDKIPGTAGDTVAIIGTAATNRYALAYDSSGNILGYRSQAYEYYTLPSDTASFVVCFKKTASKFTVYKNNVLVWEKTEAPGTMVGMEQEIGSVDKKVEALSDVPGELFTEEKVPFLGQLNYSLRDTGKFGTSASYKHSRMRVMPGDIIHFSNTNLNRSLNIAFLSSYEYTPTSGGDIPLFDSIKPFPHCLTGTNGSEIMSEKTIVIPDGCYAIAFDEYSNISPEVYIRRQKNNPIVQHYRQYISDKSFAVRKRDISLGQKADSFVFFTDYHIPEVSPNNICTNFQHSPALIEFLLMNTNTKRLMFGGDIFGSPSTDADRFSLMDAFLTKFSFKPDMYAAVGNHEWRQSEYLNNDGRVYDFGSLAKTLEGIVTFGRDSNGDITQPYYFFDNPSLKVRYFVLYTPGTNDSSSYAVFNFTEQLNFLSANVGELDNTWKVLILQHIVYENGAAGTSVYDAEGFPTKTGHTDVGNKVIQAIKTINSGNGAKVVCLLSGHIHNEFCEFIDSECVSICQNCDATYTYYNGDYKVFPNNHIRDWGSTDEQSFDVYHLDIVNKKVFGTKIGYGADKYINITEQSVSVGSTLTLSPSLSSVDTWQSQDEDIATVESGVVTGVSAGRVTIRAKKAGTPNGEWEYFNIIVS